MAEEDWCSVSEAARRLGVTPTAIRNRIKRGTLEHRPNGNQGKLVRVPLTVTLTVTPTVPEPVPLTVPEPLGGTVPLTVPPPDEPPAADGTIKAMEAHIKTLRELLDQQRADHAVELERLHVLLKQQQAQADQQERRPLWERLWQQWTRKPQ